MRTDEFGWVKIIGGKNKGRVGKVIGRLNDSENPEKSLYIVERRGKPTLEQKENIEQIISDEKVDELAKKEELSEIELDNLTDWVLMEWNKCENAEDIDGFTIRGNDVFRRKRKK